MGIVIIRWSILRTSSRVLSSGCSGVSRNFLDNFRRWAFSAFANANIFVAFPAPHHLSIYPPSERERFRLQQNISRHSLVPWPGVSSNRQHGTQGQVWEGSRHNPERNCVCRLTLPVNLGNQERLSIWMSSLRKMATSVPSQQPHLALICFISSFHWRKLFKIGHELRLCSKNFENSPCLIDIALVAPF